MTDPRKDHIRRFLEDLRDCGIEATGKPGATDAYDAIINISGTDFYFNRFEYDGWGRAAGCPYPGPSIDPRRPDDSGA